MSQSDAVPNPTPEVIDSQDQATKETPPEETKKETTNTENDDQKDRRSKTAKPRREGDDQTAENEIRVAAKGQIKNYLGYAFRILNKTNHKSLTIRATGNAIVKALILIELVKRRVGDLHQKNRIYSLEIKSEEDSKIPEGMVQDKEKTIAIRRVTAMDTELSKIPLDETDPGYQPPLPKEEKPEPQKEKDEGEKTKKSGKSHKPHKLYNTPIDGEEEKQAGNKQRRGRDKNHGKHEDDQDNNQSKKDIEGKKKGKKDKDALKGDDKGGENDKGNDDQKQKQNKKNRKQFKQNLRNIIDDEDPSKRRITRGGGDRMRHPKGDRGDGRNRYQGGGYNQMHENYGPQIMHPNAFDPSGQRQNRDRRYYRKGNDDFALSGPGDRERRGPGGQYNNHQGNQRYNHYNNYEQNNDYNDRQYRHRTQQFMYNDGGQGPQRYREQYPREDRNQWTREAPQDFRGHGEPRIAGRGHIIKGDRQFNDRPPREEQYDRERMNTGGRDQEFEDGPRQALSGNRGGRGRGERGDFRGGDRGGDRGSFRGGDRGDHRGDHRGDRGERGARRFNQNNGDHEENEFNDHRGNRGGPHRSYADRGSFRGDRGGDRGSFRGDRGGERGSFRGDRGGDRGGFRGGDRGGDRGMERRMRGGDHRGGLHRARGGGQGEFDDSEHFRGGRGRYEGDGNRGGNRQDRRGGYEDDSGGHKIREKQQRGGHANQDAPQNTSD